MTSEQHFSWEGPVDLVAGPQIENLKNRKDAVVLVKMEAGESKAKVQKVFSDEAEKQGIEIWFEDVPFKPYLFGIHYGRRPEDA